MFYLTAIAFYPALLALVVPVGLALTGMVGREESDAEARVAMAPIIGLAALSVVISLLLHLNLPANAILPVAVGLNLAAVVRLWGKLLGGSKFETAALVGWRLLAVLLLTGWLAYIVLISPLLLSGDFGVLGYKVNNDTVFHSIMPEYLDARGYDFPIQAKDGFADAAVDKFVSQGYPDGWHQILLLAMRLFGRRSWQLFNFTEAFFMALMVPIGYAWLRRGRVSLRWALFGGFVASVGYIAMSYLFQGFAPQVAVIPLIYACLYLFYEILIEGRRRWAVPAALLLQAGLAVYSFTVLIWLAVFVGALIIYRAVLIGGWRGLIGDVAVAALIGLGAAAINPFTLAPIGAAFKMVTDWSAANSMGNLVSAQVPILPVFGMWPTGDHRGVPTGWLHPAAYLWAGAVVVLILIGLKAKENRPWLWLLVFAAVVPAVVLKIGASPYYFAKTLHIAGPVAAIAAAAGIYRVSASGRRTAAVFLALFYIGGLAASDYVAVRFTAITPAAQFAELDMINQRFAGVKGLTLFVDTGEDWGKYLLANLKTASPFALSYQGPAPGVRDSRSDTGVNDLDSLKGILGRRYPLIVIAKSQDVSLAPPPYRAVYAGKFYNVYRTSGRPDGRDILSHRPFEASAGVSAAYRELQPGETVELSLGRKFASMLLSAYLRPQIPAAELDFPALTAKQSITATVGGRAVRIPVGRLPDVYALPLAGDSGTVLRVKNTALYPLRLDWIELMREPNDRAALFRYNEKNRRVRQSIERFK